MESTPMPSRSPPRFQDNIQRGANKRSRYALQACLKCRRRKVRCSGQQPCTRCVNRKLECEYDQVDEYSPPYQNVMSRLSKLEANVGISSPPVPVPSTDPFNGDKRYENAEVLDDPAVSPEISPQYDVEGFHGHTALESSIERFKNHLEPFIGKHQEHDVAASGGQWRILPIDKLKSDAHSFPLNIPGVTVINAYGKNWPFPNHRHYKQYLDKFFDDVATLHSSVNENNVREKGEALFLGRYSDNDKATFVALNYVIFGICDILYQSTPVGESRIPGRHWLILAENIEERRMFYSKSCNLTTVQYLLWKTLCVTHLDQHNLAYDISGQAARMCFRLGMHLAPASPPNDATSAFDEHQRQRVFWAVYYVDRRISQICGRPHAIRDMDITISQPEQLNDKNVTRGKPLPLPEPQNSSISFLSCMVKFSQWSGDIWEQVYAAGITPEHAQTAISKIDSEIAWWLESVFPNVPFQEGTIDGFDRGKRMRTFVITRMYTLRIFLSNSRQLNGVETSESMEHSSSFALRILSCLKEHKEELRLPSSFRYYITTSLGVVLLPLSASLLRMNNYDTNEDRINSSKFADYQNAAQDAIDMLSFASSSIPHGRRVLSQMEPIIDAVMSLINKNCGLRDEGEYSKRYGGFPKSFSHNSSATSATDSTLPPSSCLNLSVDHLNKAFRSSQELVGIAQPSGFNFDDDGTKVDVDGKDGLASILTLPGLFDFNEYNLF